MMSQTTTKVSANEALQTAILMGVIAILEESRRTNKGAENIIMRELKGIHSNTGKNDLPDHLRKALNNVTHSSMGYLNTNGYRVAPIEGK
jgi:hypothetical protein